MKLAKVLKSAADTVLSGSNDDEIKQIANNLENTDRWKIPTPQADEIYYVPKGVRRDAEDGLWITIDRFIAEIRDSEKLKLPTSDITSSY